MDPTTAEEEALESQRLDGQIADHEDAKRKTGEETLRRIATTLGQLADKIEETTQHPQRSSAEIWTAIRLLRDAGQDVMGAAMHLELHDERYGA